MARHKKHGSMHQGGSMKEGSMHQHTGKLHDHMLPMHRTNSPKGLDGHASEEYHESNKEHGCSDGMCPPPGGNAGKAVEQEGGKGMSENCSYEN